MTGVLLSEIAAGHSRSATTLRKLVLKGVVPHTRDDLGFIRIAPGDVAALVALAPRCGANRKRFVAPPKSEIEWQSSGSCRDPERSGLFFGPEDETRVARRNREAAAKTVCASCPVLTECRTWALTHREEYGVWAALGQTERKAIYATTKKAAA